MMSQPPYVLLMALLGYLPGVFAQIPIYDSGGPLSAEQAAYDVTFYEISLEVLPAEKRVSGEVILEAEVAHPMYYAVLDLDTLLTVDQVAELKPEGGRQSLPYEHEAGKIRIDLGYTRQPGASLKLAVRYGGHPREAPYAPWEGGFSWAETRDGRPWIATTCQGEGADIWWPCKDHVSDEPDSVKLHITVPDPLVVAANGRLQRTTSDEAGKTTYRWLVSTPINIYNVALNIAPYRKLETTFTSVAGDTFPFVFYVLPEDLKKGRALFPEMQDHLRWYESLFGPYPFRADKYGVAQTPHLGMEHQTIIAYGANFSNSAMTGRNWGFDALHHHELAHEWWGNLVTNSDWKDMWLHEGFGAYMQPLYVEHLQGPEAYQRYMRSSRRLVSGLPIAPRESQTSKGIYQAPIYTKGAWVLHTLRYLLGDEAFFRALRRMAYPEPALEAATDGRQCRFATSEDFMRICAAEYGESLDWLFEVYLRRAELPVLHSRIHGNVLHLSWEAPDDLPFPMPVPIVIGKRELRLEVPPEGVTYEFQAGEKPEVDPLQWILCTPAGR